jgi:diguanylate cyclase (GGDEF)-like protein
MTTAAVQPNGTVPRDGPGQAPGLRAPGQEWLRRESNRSDAGRAAGWLWLSGGLSGLAWLAIISETEPETRPAAGWLLAGASVVAGAAALRIRWGRLKPQALYTFTAAAMAVMAGVMWSTGGTASPARLYLFMTVAFAAYHFEPRRAWLYFAGAVAVHVTPFTYDARALDVHFVAEVLVAGPVYLVVGAAMLAAKKQLAAAHRQAFDLSRRDPLTGIANRRAFEEALAALVDKRSGPSALILFDLDDFKRINTEHGHPGGDAVLCAAAQAIRQSFRDGDVVARVGGDEFAVLVRVCSTDNVQSLAERALDRVQALTGALPLAGGSVRATAGWAARDYTHGGSPRALIAAADEAMYAAKDAGKGRAVGAV